MDYLGILKKAYEITIKNKFLWIFGLLGGGYGGFRFYNFSMPENTDLDKLFSSKMPDFSTFFAGHASVFIPILGIAALVALVFFVLNIISEGALIGSVAKLSRGNKSDFNEGFMVGAKNFWLILGTSIVFTGMLLVAMLIWLGPAFLLAFGGEKLIALMWGILIFFAFLAFVIALTLVAPYSFRILILKKTSIFPSIREGLHFFREHWANVLLMYLLLMAVGIGFGIALMFVCLLVGGILFFFGFLFYLIAPVAGFIYACSVGLVALALFLMIAGGYGAFSSAVLTLTYQKLTEK